MMTIENLITAAQVLISVGTAVAVISAMRTHLERLQKSVDHSAEILSRLTEAIAVNDQQHTEIEIRLDEHKGEITRLSRFVERSRVWQAAAGQQLKKLDTTWEAPRD